MLDGIQLALPFCPVDFLPALTQVISAMVMEFPQVAVLGMPIEPLT